MKRPRKAPFIIAALLLLSVAVFFIYRMENKKLDSGNYYSVATATPQPTATVAPSAVPVSTAVPTAEVTQAPTFTPTATPETTPTPSPEPTASPTPTPTPFVAYEDKGVFRSETGTWLNILVKWNVQSQEDGGYLLNLDVYTESYDLMNAKRGNDIKITVNGKTYYDSSPDINLKTSGLTETKIGTAEISVEDCSEIEIMVEWFFNGSYSNTELVWLTAGGNIHLPE